MIEPETMAEARAMLRESLACLPEIARWADETARGRSEFDSVVWDYYVPLARERSRSRFWAERPMGGVGSGA